MTDKLKLLYIKVPTNTQFSYDQIKNLGLGGGFSIVGGKGLKDLYKLQHCSLDLELYGSYNVSIKYLQSMTTNRAEFLNRSMSSIEPELKRVLIDQIISGYQPEYNYVVIFYNELKYIPCDNLATSTVGHIGFINLLICLFENLGMKQSKSYKFENANTFPSVLDKSWIHDVIQYNTVNDIMSS